MGKQDEENRKSAAKAAVGLGGAAVAAATAAATAAESSAFLAAAGPASAAAAETAAVAVSSSSGTAAAAAVGGTAAAACAAGIGLALAGTAVAYGVLKTVGGPSSRCCGRHCVGAVSRDGGEAMKPGNVVALHCGSHNRFLRMTGGGDVNGRGGSKDVERLPSDWTCELFMVVDAGDGEIALHSARHRRFVRMDDRGRVDGRGFGVGRDADDLPEACIWERFTVVDGGGGTVALHSRIHRRFVRMDDWGRVDGRGLGAGRDADSLPDGCVWERFRVVVMNGADVLRPGAVVALHSPGANRFLRVTGDDVDGRGGERNLSELPPEWYSERFTVVKAGDDEMALYSLSHRRFVRLDGNAVDAAGGARSVDNEPSADERFYVSSMPDGCVALFSKASRKFLQMDPDGAVHATWGVLECGDYTGGYHPHRFTVLRLVAHALLRPGNRVRLRSLVHGRFVRLVGDDVDGRGEKRKERDDNGCSDGDGDPAELLAVVDAGDGRIALRGEVNGRYVRVEGSDVVTAASGEDDEVAADAGAADDLPDETERFTIVDGGDGAIALHSAASGGFVRMTPSGDVDVGGGGGRGIRRLRTALARRDAGSLPDNWTWERFRVLVLDNE